MCCFNFISKESDSQSDLDYYNYSNTELEKALEKEIEKMNEEKSVENETEQTLSCCDSILACLRPMVDIFLLF